MAYPQFGYPSAASSLASTQLLSSMSAAGTTPQTSVPTSCCETGRPIMTDPQTGQTICSCQYSSSLLSYPRVASLSETVYGSAYASQGYVPFGTDPSAFYSPLNPAYDLKDGNEAWRSLAHPTACYPYDPTGMAGGYPYGQRYDPYMSTALAQRKNATREATSTLKAWLQEHIKNPYPTKGEKIMLAIITKMTLTQVSTWFANARRRLKKENKMTWSPRNRSDEDGNKLDSDDEDGDGDKDANSNDDAKDRKDRLDKSKDDDSVSDVDRDLNVCGDDPDDLSDLKVDVDDHDVVGGGGGSLLSDRLPKPVLPGLGSLHGNGTPPTLGQQSSCMNANNNNTSSKPRIWSIADVATSGNSPPGRAGGALSGSGSPAAGGGVGGSGGGLAGGLGTTGPHLGSHLLGGGASHHKLSPGADTDAYRPLINGFRPWVNGTSGVGLGSSVYPGSHHPHHATALSPVHGQSSSGGALPLSGGGGGGGGANTSGMSPVANGPLLQPTSGLLRPYALTPRTEVH